MKWWLMKYIFDILVILLFAPFILIALTLVTLVSMVFDGKPLIFKSQRVGADQKVFMMYKFRTMIIDTPVVETDLLDHSSSYITKFGRFLRMTSLDELPQIFNVIMGQMSLVGPRPALPNQVDLNKARLAMGVSSHKPGITGLAQIKGRDNLSLDDKVSFDKIYCHKRSLLYDARIIISTVIKIISRSNISH
jgi:O-antigen biosynthesis protein WbqP